MSIILNGTTGITTPDVTSDGSLKIDASAPDDSLVVDASGNVGIGASSPASKLDVSGSGDTRISVRNNDVGVVGTVRTFIDLHGRNTANEVKLQATVGSSPGLNASSGGCLVLYTNDSSSVSQERVRIDEAGKFLVNTTATGYGSIGGNTLTVVSGSSSGAGLFYTNYSGDLGTAPLKVGKFDAGSTSSQVFIQFARSNANFGCGQINGDGSGGAAFGSFSDRRLKENIQSLPPQLDNIIALRPVEFDFVESEGAGHQVGFIAQEIQEIYPDVVGVREPDGMLTVTGWSKTDARLVKAIQELKAINDAQAQTITAQQAALESLTARVVALEGQP